MNPRNNKRTFTKKTCVVATQFALAMMASQVTLAQQAPSTQVAQTTAPKAGERIEVTGSRIPMQQNVESTSPVVVLGTEDINMTGLRNVEDVLNSLPMVNPDFGNNQSNGATGTATVNLRNLGANRTLVLVNGRRLPAGSPSLYATDLNQIPATLIERVEVLTGGASAVYGSDAVAGVVNFIMKQNFQGVQGDVNYSWYQHNQHSTGNIIDALNKAHIDQPGDFGHKGDSTDVSLTMGSNFANDKGNATVFFSYKKDHPVLQSAYDYSKCALGANADGSWSCAGSSTSDHTRITPLTPTVGRPVTPIDAAGNVRLFNNATDLFNFAPFNYFTRPSERYGFAAFAHYDLTPKARLYSEFMFHDDHTDAQIAPSGAFGVPVTVGFDNPFISPQLRGILGLTGPGTTADIIIQHRNVEGGGRDDDIRHTSYREVLGVKGDLGRDWEYDIWMQTAKVLYQEIYRHDFSTVRLQAALDATTDPATGLPICRSTVAGCVPYNIFQTGGVTPGALAFLETPGFKKGNTQQTVQGATISTGDLTDYGLKVPTARSGIAFAAGVERRTEKLQLETDVEFTTGDLAGQGGPTIGLAGQYTVKEIYAETRIPIIEERPMFDTLAVNASYRFSDYSTDVQTHTYGIGGEWGPVRSFKFRGSYQKATRAANVIELFTAQGLNLFGLAHDPCGPARTATLAQCQRTGITAANYGSDLIENPAGQYNFLQGGNPALQPEDSKSYTLGFVWTPSNNLSATIDYFNIKLDNVISNIPPATALQQCLQNGSFCDLVHRDALGTLWLPNGGFITATNLNLAKWKTDGVDVALNYNYAMGHWGRLGLNFTGTWTEQFRQEPVPGLGEFDCAGLFGPVCGSPQAKWRHRVRGTWSTPWAGVDLAATWRHINEVKNEGTKSDDALHVDDIPPQDQKLAARDYLDLAAQWAFSKRLTFRGGVNNILDKDPPIVSNTLAGPNIFGNGNTFPQLYDSLGRRFFVGLTLSL